MKRWLCVLADIATIITGLLVVWSALRLTVPMALLWLALEIFVFIMHHHDKN